MAFGFAGVEDVGESGEELGMGWSTDRVRHSKKPWGCSERTSSCVKWPILALVFFELLG